MYFGFVDINSSLFLSRPIVRASELAIVIQNRNSPQDFLIPSPVLISKRRSNISITMLEEGESSKVPLDGLFLIFLSSFAFSLKNSLSGSWNRRNRLYGEWKSLCEGAGRRGGELESGRKCKSGTKGEYRGLPGRVVVFPTRVFITLARRRLERPSGSYPCTSGSTGIKTSIVDIVSCLQTPGTRSRAKRNLANKRRRMTTAGWSF